MKKLGVTGSRTGPTQEQAKIIDLVLTDPQLGEVHHGDCIGVDAYFDAQARARGLTRIIRPAITGPDNRALCYLEGGIYVQYEPAEPLARNLQIVQAVDILYAFPSGYVEQRRSGTWATIRYARTHGVAHKIIFPNGTESY